MAEDSTQPHGEIMLYEFLEVDSLGMHPWLNEKCMDLAVEVLMDLAEVAENYLPKPGTAGRTVRVSRSQAVGLYVESMLGTNVSL